VGEAVEGVADLEYLLVGNLGLVQLEDAAAVVEGEQRGAWGRRPTVTRGELTINCTRNCADSVSTIF
jgi:hypothetical protein